jgi:predicted PurR-regulated permease PerM
VKWRNQHTYIRWGLTAFLVIVGSITFYFMFFENTGMKAGIAAITNVLMPLVMGLITAYLLTPVLIFYENHLLNPLFKRIKTKKPEKRKSLIRAIGILLTTLSFLFVIYILIYMLVSQIVPSIQSLVLNFDKYANNFTAWLQNLMIGTPIRDFIVANIDTYSDQLLDWLNTTMNETILPFTRDLVRDVSLSLLNLLKVFWNFIIGFVIAIYVLASKEKFAGQSKKFLYAICRKETANVIIHNLRFSHNTFIKYLSGVILDSLIIGIMCFMVTSIMRTPYAALVSVIIGVTNIIPFFGPFLGAIPTALLILMVDISNPLTCVYFLIFILILQQLDGNFIKPRILGGSIGISGFWIIFSITLFGGIWGVFGMIIGVPIFAILYAAVNSTITAKLRKKDLPDTTKQYLKVDYIDETGFHEGATDLVDTWKKLPPKPKRQE